MEAFRFAHEKVQNMIDSSGIGLIVVQQHHEIKYEARSDPLVGVSKKK